MSSEIYDQIDLGIKLENQSRYLEDVIAWVSQPTASSELMYQFSPLDGPECRANYLQNEANYLENKDSYAADQAALD